MRHKLNGMTITLATMITLGGAAMVASSGQLDPPPGRVSPTGASLNDIFLNLNQSDSPEAVDPGMAAFPGGVGFMFIYGDGGEVPREGILDGPPIAVFGFSHHIGQTRDAASGLPTGRRQHKPFTVTKPIDKATPLLMNALVNNHSVGDVEIQLGNIPRGIDGFGDSVSYTLVGARVLSVSPFTRGMAPDAVVFMEEVEFAYERIIVSSLEGGITAEDDWETPVAD